MSAVSVLGRIGTHCAPRKSGESDLSGLIETNSMPASFPRRSQVSRLCTPAPPDVTWQFLSARPPNAITSRAFLTMDDQSVMSPTTGWKVPMTRGKTYCAAPKLELG